MPDDTLPMLRCIDCFWHVQDAAGALAHTAAHPSGHDKWTGVEHRLSA